MEKLGATPLERWQNAAMALLLAAVIVAKFLLVPRININWDEFHYLEIIHSQQRGDSIPLLQTFHVRLFGWLSRVASNEAHQIIVARYVMMVLLLGTAFCLWRLARLWADGWAAWVAPLTYLLAFPVFKHSASFRFDSLLAPLVTSAILLLCLDRRAPRLLLAAALYGLCLAISIKATLAAPMLAAVVLLGSTRNDAPLPSRLKALVIFGAVSGLVAAILLGAHYLSIAPHEESSFGLMSRAASVTVTEQRWFPTRYIFLTSWRVDRVVWLAIAAGLAVAVARRQWTVASFALVLLPLAFYRNAFPYYYAVLLTPTAVLASVGVSWIFGKLEALRSFRTPATVFWLALVVLLGAKFWLLVGQHAPDRVSHQVALIDAVHQTFPEPVPYIDHSGMIASFPKSGFFMSSWGIMEYQATGRPFTREAIERQRSPLLLVNRPVLHPDSRYFGWLLKEDQERLVRGYVPWWGAIRVAGAAGPMCEPQSPNEFPLPYPGTYRIVSDAPVSINGRVVDNGDILVLEGPVKMGDPSDPFCEREPRKRVEIVDARVTARPTGAPPKVPVYDEL